MDARPSNITPAGFSSNGENMVRDYAPQQLYQSIPNAAQYPVAQYAPDYRPFQPPPGLPYRSLPNLIVGSAIPMVTTMPVVCAAATAAESPTFISHTHTTTPNTGIDESTFIISSSMPVDMAAPQSVCYLEKPAPAPDVHQESVCLVQPDPLPVSVVPVVDYSPPTIVPLNSLNPDIGTNMVTQADPNTAEDGLDVDWQSKMERRKEHEEDKEEEEGEEGEEEDTGKEENYAMATTEDQPTESDASYEGSNPDLLEAVISKAAPLPEGLEYRQFGEGVEGLGIVAATEINKGFEFGPCCGEFMTDDIHQNLLSWELCLDGKVAAYIVPDATRDWTCSIRCARLPEECNLEAGQRYGRIYFTAVERILPGKELRVFYGREYRENCGMFYSLESLQYDEEREEFPCSLCDATRTSSKAMVRHLKFAHGDAATPSLSQPPTTVIRQLQDTTSVPVSENERENSVAMEDNHEKDGRLVVPVERAVVILNDVGSDPQRFICATCGKNFPSHGRLLMHESFHMDSTSINVHTGDGAQEVVVTKPQKPKPFTCRRCGKCYCRRSTLLRHIREAHDVNHFERSRRTANNEPLEHAPIRRKVKYGQGNAVQQNQQRVTFAGIKRQCRMCKYVAPSPRFFKMHMLQHQKKSAYGCRMCGKVYSGKMQLNQHTCTRDKHGMMRETYRPPRERVPIVDANGGCTQCKFKCNDADELLCHMQRHVGAPFGCRDCGLVFEEVEDLFEHMASKHGNMNREIDYPDVALPSDIKIVAGRCGRCGFHSERAQRLVDHMSQHLSHPYGCHLCGNVYSAKHHRERHIDEKHQNNPKEVNEADAENILARAALDCTCQQCGFRTTSTQLLKQHKRRHIVAPYGCDRCGAVFTQQHLLLRHQKDRHSEESSRLPQEKCLTCGFVCPDPRILKDHMTQHITHPSGCNICGNVYRLFKHLMRHKREKHSGAMPARTVKRRRRAMSLSEDRCMKCGFRCSNRELLIQHRRQHGRSSFGCDVCGKVFIQRTILQQHKRDMHGPIASRVPISEGNTCLICEFKTENKAALKEHVEGHETHPFGCDICGNVYTQNFHVQRHKKEKHEDAVSHQGKKSHDKEDNLCQQCGFKCWSQQGLVRHKRKHKEFPFGCDVCGDVFEELKPMIRHRTQKHEGNPHERSADGQRNDGDYDEDDDYNGYDDDDDALEGGSREAERDSGDDSLREGDDSEDDGEENYDEGELSW